ncbi:MULTISPECIES: hypothetical protein [unclassified Nostoc]|uniref:hypothetical protein n=1 Tax=unclassified Nostoc TaxID=2593658 RepID=UPI0011801912|nr:hypothetical protein [Nostoc sp. 'Peltigera membranacea cyanobiont' 232]
MSTQLDFFLPCLPCLPCPPCPSATEYFFTWKSLICAIAFRTPEAIVKTDKPLGMGTVLEQSGDGLVEKASGSQLCRN